MPKRSHNNSNRVQILLDKMAMASPKKDNQTNSVFTPINLSLKYPSIFYSIIRIVNK